MSLTASSKWEAPPKSISLVLFFVCPCFKMERYILYTYIYTSIYFRRFAEADVYLSSLCWRPELNTLCCLFAGWKRNFALGGFYLHSEAFFFVVFALDMQLYKYLLTACFSEEKLQTGSLKEKRFRSEGGLGSTSLQFFFFSKESNCQSNMFSYSRAQSNNASVHKSRHLD